MNSHLFLAILYWVLLIVWGIFRFRAVSPQGNTLLYDDLPAAALFVIIGVALFRGVVS